MRIELVTELFRKLPKTSNEFFEVEDKEKETIKIINRECFDDIQMILICKGFEKYVMEDPSVICVGLNWNINMFALMINQLIAEHFGEGQTITLREWFDATKRAIESITTEGYQNHNCISPNVIRKYIK